jgi:hypothetical protein
MRLPVMLGLLVACGASNKPSADPPPPATSSLLDCVKVSDHVAATVAGQTPRSGVTPGAVKDMVATRCRTDAWSNATKHCMYAIKLMSEGRACATGMTDVQRDAIKAHARQLRADASGSSAEPDGQGSDWIKHVVEE